jgi:fused signal recognition particle receptor
MTIVYILLVVVVVAAIYFLTRKPSEPALPPKPEDREPAAEKKLPAKPSTSGREIPGGKRADKEKKEERLPARAEEPAKAEKPEEAPAQPPKAEKPKPVEEDFGKAAAFDPATVRKGLSKTRGGMIAKLADLFRGRKEIDPSLLQEIEEVLLSSDVGVKTTRTLIERLTSRLERKELSDEEKVWAALRAEAQEILGAGGRLKLRGKPTVVMLVGVNGSGKTTTIGKLASKLKAQGKTVVLGAGDTFRAAAVQQLEVWGEREGAAVVKGKEGADPASVLFDAVNKAKDSGADAVLCDTAGRLHTKTNLMEELSKVRRTVAKALDGAPHETLLVLDATNGQNALQQAKQFQEAIELTGVVLTKLDGTAKGGVILAIADELRLPVRYIGIGERSADLREFDAAEFVEALFSSREAISTEAA